MTQKPITETIAERAKLHGDFTNTGMCAQRIKDDIRAWVPNWHALRPYQREALDQIAQKIARIMTGNPDEPDHWRDLSGYATMVEIRLMEGK